MREKYWIKFFKSKEWEDFATYYDKHRKLIDDVFVIDKDWGAPISKTVKEYNSRKEKNKRLTEWFKYNYS